VLPSIGLDKATRLAELLRQTVCNTPFDLREHGLALAALPVTISLGVSTLDTGNAAHITAPEQVTHAADQGVYAAKKAGRNCVRSVAASPAHSAPAPGDGAGSAPPTPIAAPKPPGRYTIMVIEDDPLASLLIVSTLEKCAQMCPVPVRSSEEAIEYLAKAAGSGRAGPAAILCDLNLPGASGLDLLRKRNGTPWRHTPFFVMSALTSKPTEAECRAAGAAGFIDKADFCAHTDDWINRILASVTGAARVAA